MDNIRYYQFLFDIFFKKRKRNRLKLHEVVKSRRKSIGLSQETIAGKLGVTQSSISAAETGGNETVLNRMIGLFVTEYGFRYSDFEDPEDQMVRLREEVNKCGERLQQTEKHLYKLSDKLEKHIFGAEPNG